MAQPDDQGQLFSTGAYERPSAPFTPGWGKAHGRPQYPGQKQKQPQHEQLELPFNRKVNGNQFNKSPARKAMENLVEAHSRAQYFRHAGMGAAIRYTLGMEQTPSHMNDYINARSRGRRQSGLNPGDVNAMLGDEA